MKKSTIFLTLAVVFAVFSFTGKVKAQSDPNGVPVWLTYGGYLSYVTFNVEFYNKDISEDYFFDTINPQYDEPNTYRLGKVPPGNYRVSISLWPSHSIPHYGLYFNWSAGTQSGNYVHVDSQYYTILTEDIEIEEPSSSGPALHLYITDY
ncbi:hypothetical protein [Parapedobacter tibetensis]|uniref:hypothetical protein n=1 Tax=Parapedobacter tibetensis TaxID=2972951 RepID=UPI00214DDDEF|nr:hypothetical protein [Parapedobacter tibetensis]